MHLLVGLPLKLFKIIFLVLRFAWPVLLILLLVWLRQRQQKRAARPQDPPGQDPKEPTFRGPVYTVDYTEVEETPPEEDGHDL